MDKKVVVVGDVGLDRYVFGTADRLSPEAVVPVLRVTSEYYALSGAGQVAAVVEAQGVMSGLVWPVGRNDVFAEQVTTLLGKYGVWNRQVQVTPGRFHTPRRTRYVADARQLLQVDDVSADGPSDADVAHVTTQVCGLLPEAGVLVMVDRNRGTLTSDSVFGLTSAAGRTGVKTVANVLGGGSAYRGISVAVVPWGVAAGLYGDDRFPVRDGDPAVAGRFVQGFIRDQYFEHVVIDASQYGLFWGERRCDDRPADVVRIMPHGRPVVDPTGSSEVVLGALAAEVCRGTPMAEALVRAHAAAGEAVSRVGTPVVLRHEVEAALARHPAGGHKVMTPDKVKLAADTWRLVGRKVGCAVADFYTTGVDAVRFVAAAAAECDSLVVVVTDPIDPSSDALPLEFRVELLAALGHTAAVVAAPAGRELAAVRAVHPDVLVVPPGRSTSRAADHVSSYGGRVIASAYPA